MSKLQSVNIYDTDAFPKRLELPIFNQNMNSYVIKSGSLQKRGNISCACSSRTNYYLDSRGYFIQSDCGNKIIQKFDITNSIIQVKKSKSSNFTVICGKTKLKLKARDCSDRDDWVNKIKFLQGKLSEQDKQLKKSNDDKRELTKLSASKLTNQSQITDNKEQSDNHAYSDSLKHHFEIFETNSHCTNDQMQSEIRNNKSPEETRILLQKIIQELNEEIQQSIEQRPLGSAQRKLVKLAQPGGEQEFDFLLSEQKINGKQKQISLELVEDKADSERIEDKQSSDIDNLNTDVFNVDRYYDSVQNPDPSQRSTLPFLKDPKQKINFFTFLKDCIGKDLSKISMPVYFNHPLSIMQRTCTGFEYSYLLDEGIKQDTSLKRLAYISAFYTTYLTHFEHATSKPFNPLLGETFEYVTPSFKYISESVSHHPPIVGLNCQGNSGYEFHGLVRPNKPQISGGSIRVTQHYKSYLDFKPHNEKYEIELPHFRIHNLIFGKMYMGISDDCIISNTSKPGERAKITFSEKKASTPYKVYGEITNDKNQVVYKIEGKWNEFCDIIDVKSGLRERVWQKTPYPELFEQMYGFSDFMLQLNYLPNYMKNKLPPTDSRFRPDQRALENGEMRVAVSEKDRLENKQRAYIKSLEKNGVQFKPNYFDEYQNPLDNNEIYWKYNRTYWEQDRLQQDWSRLPDIFSVNNNKELEQV